MEFHIKEREGFDNEPKDDADKERIQRAWGNKHRNPEEYKFARNGDHLLVPFQCDLCIFRKLTGRTPHHQSDRDKVLMACIRRINLDAFWSRASSTVISNRDRIRSACNLSDSLGVPNPYEFIGAMPDHDAFGYTVAIQMIMASTKSGRYSSAYTQWDTIRKVRSVYSNFIRASPQSNNELWALGDDKGKVQRFYQDPCSSFWFSRFFIGCKNRMGQDWRPNRAFSIDLLLAFLDLIEERMEVSDSIKEENKWTVAGAYAVLTYVVSLRGSEGFLLDLGGLRRHAPKESDKFFLIPLLGKVKGESHDRCHLLPCTFKTSSGIEPYRWFAKLIAVKEKQGLKDGPAISDEIGQVLTTMFMNDLIQEVLEDLFEQKRELFPKTITSKDELAVNYQAFRSFRRTSDTRAINQHVKADIIELVNRWHAVEKADGNRAAFNMRNHYAQYEDLINPFLTYTKAM